MNPTIEEARALARKAPEPPAPPQDFAPFVAIEQRLLALCADLGIKATFSDTMPDYAYAPGHITYCGRREERISNLAHDIAHWLIAPEYRRKKVDFGLGDSPDSMEHSYPCVTYESAEKEELLASAYGTRIEEWAGASPQWTMDFHGWDDDGGGAQITVYLMRLVDRNLLHDDFRFTPERAKLGAKL